MLRRARPCVTARCSGTDAAGACAPARRTCGALPARAAPWWRSAPARRSRRLFGRRVPAQTARRASRMRISHPGPAHAPLHTVRAWGGLRALWGRSCVRARREPAGGCSRGRVDRRLQKSNRRPHCTGAVLGTTPWRSAPRSMPPASTQVVLYAPLPPRTRHRAVARGDRARRLTGVRRVHRATRAIAWPLRSTPCADRERRTCPQGPHSIGSTLQTRWEHVHAPAPLPVPRQSGARGA